MRSMYTRKTKEGETCTGNREKENTMTEKNEEKGESIQGKSERNKDGANMRSGRSPSPEDKVVFCWANPRSSREDQTDGKKTSIG